MLVHPVRANAPSKNNSAVSTDQVPKLFHSLSVLYTQVGEKFRRQAEMWLIPKGDECRRIIRFQFTPLSATCYPCGHLFATLGRRSTTSYGPPGFGFLDSMTRAVSPPERAWR